MEKATVLSWAFNSGAKSAYLMDSDISFMGPLPNDPVSTKLGLSRHRLRPGDELKYGIYNAGFLWTSDPTIPEQWLLAAKTSRYYDQAALEDLATAQPTHEFPVQNNYGWWRMFQGVEPPITVQSFWSVFRNKDNANSGIRIYGEPVLSIHTHWDQTTSTTKLFNDFIFSKLRLLGKYEPAQILSRFLAKEFPHLLS